MTVPQQINIPVSECPVSLSSVFGWRDPLIIKYIGIARACLDLLPSRVTQHCQMLTVP